MCTTGWNADSSCINLYVDSFKDISDDIIPAFEAAYGVEIKREVDGWRERNLVASEWSWLFPDLEDDKKAATV